MTLRQVSAGRPCAHSACPFAPAACRCFETEVRTLAVGGNPAASPAGASGARARERAARRASGGASPLAAPKQDGEGWTLLHLVVFCAYTAWWGCADFAAGGAAARRARANEYVELLVAAAAADDHAEEERLGGGGGGEHAAAAAARWVAARDAKGRTAADLDRELWFPALHVDARRSGGRRR